MKKSQRSAIRRLAITTLVTIASAGAAVTTQAAYIATATETGGNVVIEGSGSIDLQAWTIEQANGNSVAGVRPNAWLLLGGTNLDNYDSASLSGPTTIGPGTLSRIADSTVGPYVGIGWQASYVRVPAGYVSGDALTTSSMEFTGETFSTLGITPGTYEWTWGSGASEDSFTLNVGAVPVPAAVWLFGSGLLGLVGVARRKARA
jgi:hypothetical protein